MTESLRTAPELAYLESFRAVCEAGSFTAAARLLGCSQPAVSYQIRNLEECFGVTLFERGGRRVVLTAEGRRLSTFVEGLFTRLAEVRHECAGAYVFEPLRLAAASGFGRYVLMPALHSLLREGAGGTPEIRLEFESADVLLDRLEQGRYEGVFVYKRRISSALAYERVCREELVLVAPPGLAGGRTDLADLQRLPFVTYEECEYVFGRWFDAVFGSQPSRLTSRASFTELEEVLDFVAAGVGVSIVPRDAAIARCASGEIAVVRPRDTEACLNDVYLATRAGSDVRPVVRRLIGLIGRSVAE